MKIALIGDGKTGSEIRKMLSDDMLIEVFNSENPPTVDKLKKTDVAIIFVPGVAVESIIPIVLESEVLAVWGSTGYKWPCSLNDMVCENHTRWIIASNFSLGMNLIRHCLKVLSKGSKLIGKAFYRIHEAHHVNKKDQPSGTALKWKEWLDVDCDIASVREGDAKGIHQLTVETKYERIQLSHEVLDRALFAHGAIWAANYLFENPDMDYGVYDFSDIVDREIWEGELK